MENLNNPVEEEKIEAPVETVESPIVEEVIELSDTINLNQTNK